MILLRLGARYTEIDVRVCDMGAAAEKRDAEGHNVRRAAGSLEKDGVTYLRRSWFVCFGREHEQSDLRTPFL
jgi:hypothetical protein